MQITWINYELQGYLTPWLACLANDNIYVSALLIICNEISLNQTFYMNKIPLLFLMQKVNLEMKFVLLLMSLFKKSPPQRSFPYT